MVSGHFRSFDGTRLYYSLRGPKGAPTLLFCYGLVCSELQWRYQMEFFVKDYQILFMDYRGHGHSDTPTNSIVTIQDLAQDITKLLHELKIEKVILLGHSLGVNVCLDFYRLAPQLIQAMVLANGTPKDPFETMFHHNFLQAAFPLFRLAHKKTPALLEAAWKYQGENFLNHEFIGLVGFNTKYAAKEDIKQYLRNSSTLNLNVFMSLLDDFVHYDATHWLDEIKVPTLVLAGEKDMITPAKNQKIMHKLIPKSKYVEIKEGSHCPQMEQIKLVNEILGKFFLKGLAKKPKIKKVHKKLRAGSV